MRLTILGSGRAGVIPRPGCPCRICASARQEGGRSWRAGRTILTHLSDIHGHTPAEFDALATSLAPLQVEFAYDGLTVNL